MENDVKIPKVLIQYGKLIDPVYIFYCQNNPDLEKFGWNKWTPPDQTELKRRISSYIEIWSKNENKILTEISKSLNLSFNRDVIDVYIVSGISRATSNPIIIKSGFTPKEFLITLTHELIHRIQALNEPQITMKILSVFDMYCKEETQSVKNHVVVYATLINLFENDNEMLGIIKNSTKNNSEYIRAYELAKPYKEILEFYRKAPCE